MTTPVETILTSVLDELQRRQLPFALCDKLEPIVGLDCGNYAVVVDHADVDEQPAAIGLADKPLYAGRVNDHVDLLTTCVDALRKSPYRERIRDLTTDGDHKDCEAIFHLDGVWYVIRIRPR